MAELADALDLGSSEATRTGSIPARCTILMKLSPFPGQNCIRERGFLWFSFNKKRTKWPLL